MLKVRMGSWKKEAGSDESHKQSYILLLEF